MKKTLILSALIGAAVMASRANGTGNDDPIQKSWFATESYSAVVVSGKLNVFLVEGDNAMVAIKGDSKGVNAVSLEIENETLKVSGTEYGEEVTIYIPVKHLKELTVEEGPSLIRSVGHLQSDKLKLRIAANCEVRVQTIGKVEIMSDESNGYYYYARRKRK